MDMYSAVQTADTVGEKAVPEAGILETRISKCQTEFLSRSLGHSGPALPW